MKFSANIWAAIYIATDSNVTSNILSYYYFVDLIMEICLILHQKQSGIFTGMNFNILQWNIEDIHLLVVSNRVSFSCLDNISWENCN